MQQNPTALMALMCLIPLVPFLIGLWIGRGGPLPGGRRFVIGVKDGRDLPYDDQ